MRGDRRARPGRGRHGRGPAPAAASPAGSPARAVAGAVSPARDQSVPVQADASAGAGGGGGAAAGGAAASPAGIAAPRGPGAGGSTQPRSSSHSSSAAAAPGLRPALAGAADAAQRCRTAGVRRRRRTRGTTISASARRTRATKTYVTGPILAWDRATDARLRRWTTAARGALRWRDARSRRRACGERDDDPRVRPAPRAAARQRGPDRRVRRAARPGAGPRAGRGGAIRAAGRRERRGDRARVDRVRGDRAGGDGPQHPRHPPARALRDRAAAARRDRPGLAHLRVRSPRAVDRRARLADIRAGGRAARLHVARQRDRALDAGSDLRAAHRLAHARQRVRGLLPSRAGRPPDRRRRGRPRAAADATRAARRRAPRQRRRGLDPRHAQPGARRPRAAPGGADAGRPDVVGHRQAGRGRRLPARRADADRRARRPARPVDVPLVPRAGRQLALPAVRPPRPPRAQPRRHAGVASARRRQPRRRRGVRVGRRHLDPGAVEEPAGRARDGLAEHDRRRHRQLRPLRAARVADQPDHRSAPLGAGVGPRAPRDVLHPPALGELERPRPDPDRALQVDERDLARLEPGGGRGVGPRLAGGHRRVDVARGLGRRRRGALGAGAAARAEQREQQGGEDERAHQQCSRISAWAWPSTAA